MRLAPEIPPLPPRVVGGHKGTYGRLLVLAGSEGMTGAAALVARAAYRAGAGLVQVAIERHLFSSISPAVAEAIFLDRADWRGKLTAEGLAGYQGVVVGPGLGTAGTREMVLQVLESCPAPAVVDADGLNLLAAESRWPLGERPDRVWTPHPGEFARLTGEKPEGDEERVAAARRFVEKRGGVLVLKGHRTVVMDRTRYAINETGNPGMSTAGTGDVLSGMIAAFLGQKLEPFSAARLAAHLHGLAGDLAAARLGQISLIASDLVDELPRAILKIEKDQPWKKG